MKISALLLFLTALFVSDSYSQALSTGPRLPPVTPTFCAKNICVFARGPYAIKRMISLSEASQEGLAFLFQDGTVMSFGAVATRAECSAFNKKWLNQGALHTRTYLCIPSEGQDNTLVSIKIRSYMASMIERFQGESEICVWHLNMNKTTISGVMSLPISSETCVGDRMGSALPAQADNR